jgi:hypothetical protein
MEELEALVLGKLDAETAAAVQKHSVECGACGDELTWLRAEQALMARRREAQALSPSLWQGIAARIAEPCLGATPSEAAPDKAAPNEAAPQPAGPRVQAARPSSPSQPRRWHWSARVAYSGLITAAAAALLFVAWPRGTTPSPVPDPRPVVRAHKKLAPDVALSNAENEYAEALAVLEAQYKAKRGELPPSLAKRYDSMIAETRSRVSDARIAAGNDVDGRMLVLDGYEEYMRSLQKIVSDIR